MLAFGCMIKSLKQRPKTRPKCQNSNLGCCFEFGICLEQHRYIFFTLYQFFTRALRILWPKILVKISVNMWISVNRKILGSITEKDFWTQPPQKYTYRNCAYIVWQYKGVPFGEVRLGGWSTEGPQAPTLGTHVSVCATIDVFGGGAGGGHRPPLEYEIPYCLDSRRLCLLVGYPNTNTY